MENVVTAMYIIEEKSWAYYNIPQYKNYSYEKKAIRSLSTITINIKSYWLL